MIVVQFHSLARCYSVFTTALTKEIAFSPLYILGFSVVNELTIYVWIYLWGLYSVLLISVCAFFMPVSYYFDYYSFIIYFKLTEHDPTTLFFQALLICHEHRIILIHLMHHHHPGGQHYNSFYR